MSYKKNESRIIFSNYLQNFILNQRNFKTLVFVKKHFKNI